MDTCCGAELILAAIGAALVLGVAAFRRRNNGGAGDLGSSNSSSRSSAQPRPQTAEALVRDGQDDFLEMGESNPVQVRGRGRLLELKHTPGNPKVKYHVEPGTGETFREFMVLALAGKRLLVEQPVAEGGALAFFLFDDKTREMPPGFGEYLRGTPGSPGPVKKFADSNQQGDISFDALGKTWKCMDILHLDVQITEGELFVRSSGRDMPRIAAVLGKNGDDWILYAELKSGQGNSTLWVGREFDPQTEITV